MGFDGLDLTGIDFPYASVCFELMWLARAWHRGDKSISESGLIEFL